MIHILVVLLLTVVPAFIIWHICVLVNIFLLMSDPCYMTGVEKFMDKAVRRGISKRMSIWNIYCVMQQDAIRQMLEP